MSKNKMIQLQINEENKKLTNGMKSYKGIRRHPTFKEVYCLYLEEVKGERILPIVIGTEQAISIICILAKEKPKRPHTHDIFTILMEKYNIKLTHVIINNVKVDNNGYGVFHSKMFFENNKKNKLELDSRTSDAVAMACRFKSPIYTFENIMQKASYNIAIKKLKKDINKTKNTKSIKELKIELANCVKKENYEKASKIRDEIKKRENEH